ncbi:CoA-transferase family III [Blastococcus aggregatus]|uniref:CoA-transferase family III n=1 Tax=Blastococcus aggregatus TaxID=38502 RepID=A0A285VFF0_9ACTN|nr:CoA transferase [Blastococcus aggregatus]SOC52298.1 CoA-transferase family III [Blastococcus aggregatus]
MSSLLAEVAAVTGLPAAAVQPTGSPGLGGPLAVDDLVTGAVAAQLHAARLLAGGDGPVRPDGRLRLDGPHVGLAVRSERYARLAGRPVGMGFAPLSRFWRTADGWLRLHGNYPHHRAAAASVLGSEEVDAVAAAAARWRAEELESAVVAAGGAAAAVRTPEEWAGSPQGRAVAGLPLLGLNRVVDGPARRPELHGLRVLDLTRVIAGPVATRVLASHGADVLRVDGPRQPDLREGLLDTGVGKRHVVLDLADAGDRGTVEELLASADVVVQGYRPGALDAFGLDPASLAARHPHLVVVRLSAWGLRGPWAGRRGFDSLVQAATGIATVSGAPEEPGVLPAQALDHATGYLAAATVLAALARQRDEGGGWYGELSLAQTAHWLLAAPRTASVPGPSVDPGPYLQTLDSPDGPVTVVAPPGSPRWTAAAVLPPAAHPAWRSRSGAG